MDYHIGDKVIHSNYGLGEIIQMDEKTIHGHQTSCYVVRVRDLTIWVPADNSVEKLRLNIYNKAPKRGRSSVG